MHRSEALCLSLISFEKCNIKNYPFRYKTYLTMMLQAYVSNTVGMYSLGKASVAYTIRRHVLPTAPSPTTTHLMLFIVRKGVQ